MSFTQQLQLVLGPASTLPPLIDLGEWSCSWENDDFKIVREWQPGFRKLSRDELMQLMRRLHDAPHAIVLNLYGHTFGEAVMREMAVPMAALSKLQALFLSGNSIGAPGCIALSSSLVHLSHLKVLHLRCEFV